jgi:hypothetical protein
VTLGAERTPEPQIVLRRTLELHLRRTLEVSVIEDATGRVDVWLRVRSPDGRQVGQLHAKPSALRELSDLLASVAAELGVEP